MPNVAARAPRILVCTDTYPPQLNGVSVVTHLSVRGLADRGWDCAVIGPRYPVHGRPASLADAAVTHASIPSMPAPGYSDLRLAVPWYPPVARAIAQFQPDVVHCATEFMVGRLGQRVARRQRIPLISSYHTDFGRYAETYGVRLAAPAIRRYLARFHQRSARVLTPSNASASDLAALGVGRVRVWGRGVDTRVFHPSRRHPETRERLGLGSRFTFLHVGRLAAEKNVELILEAYIRASTCLPAGIMQLVLAGTGPRERTLRAMAPPGILFAGRLDREHELPDLYANADAFVFSSLTETLGLVILEAFASGLPVIAAPAGGVADHLRDGVNGASYRPGDADALAAAMIGMVENPLRVLDLRSGARRTAEALDWNEELDRLDDDLRMVMDESRKPQAERSPVPAGEHFLMNRPAAPHQETSS